MGMTDYGHSIECGIFVTPAAHSADDVVGLAVLAEEVGYDLVTFPDHPYSANTLDTWTLLSFIAAKTSRVRVSANVQNLPLRPPAVLARSVASLDVLSQGRAELALGAGAFWDAIEGMGAERRGAGESVEALEEGIHVIRELWATDQRDKARFEGEYYRLADVHRGPTPLHDINIWVGGYKPRMLDLIGRLADGWLPSVPYIATSELNDANAMIDAAATSAGRDPRAIRRLLNIEVPDGSASEAASEFARLALEEGIGTFIIPVDDPQTLVHFASEVMPRLRELVEAARDNASTSSTTRESLGGPDARPADHSDITSAPTALTEEERLGITPTPDDGVRVSLRVPWDDADRPRRARSSPSTTYSEQGRRVAKELLQIHDLLRRELSELRDVLEQVRTGKQHIGQARATLDQMTLRQNDWTLGAFCARYCGFVGQHHGIEDAAVFPHLAQREPQLAPIINRLIEEHQVIHVAIEEVDQALTDHIAHPEDYQRIQDAIDYLSDSLTSHLAYEEQELLEPLARHGFYPNQIVSN